MRSIFNVLFIYPKLRMIYGGKVFSFDIFRQNHDNLNCYHWLILNPLATDRIVLFCLINEKNIGFRKKESSLLLDITSIAN